MNQVTFDISKELIPCNNNNIIIPLRKIKASKKCLQFFSDSNKGVTQRKMFAEQ